MAWTICSKEDVIALHGMSIDDLRDFWSETAEAFLVEHTGNHGLLGDLTIEDEIYTGNGAVAIVVKKPPILSVQEVSINDYVVPSGDYVFNTHTITLKYGEFSANAPANVKLSYTAGVSQVDAQYRFACAAMVAAIANHEGRKGADTTIRWATLPTQAGGSTANLNVGLVTNMKAIMKQSVRRTKVRVG